MVWFQTKDWIRQGLAGVLSLVLVAGQMVLPLSARAEDGSKPRIHFSTLASGQQVYVQESHSQPIVTIDTWVNTGSAQETAENNGVSHFLEHLLFKGTHKHAVGEIDRILESRGAEFNAATSNDFTHYHITTATPYLEEALALHADMLLNATIEVEELDRERKVVQEEINRALDNPARKTYLALEKAMFGSHPYSMDTLGPKSNIQNLPRQAILDYYHRWYQPQNFKTVIAGDVRSEDAVAMVSEAFGKAFQEAPRPEPGQPRLESVKPLTTPQSAVFGDTNLSEAQLALGFIAPPVEARQDNYALDIAAIVLGQGQSSRLVKRLRESEQLVSGISASNSTQQQSGIFLVAAQLKPENRAKAKAAILEELTRLKTEGPTAEEVKKAQTQIVKDFAFLNETTDGVATTIGYNVTIGKLEDYTDYVANIQQVTPEAVRQAAAQYLSYDRAVLVEALPDDIAGDTALQAQNNARFLADAASSSYQGPAVLADAESPRSEIKPLVIKKTLQSGTTLLLKPTTVTQTLAINLMAKGGRLVEPKPGVSSLTSQVLMKGTTNRTAEQLSEALERTGLNLAADSDEDYLQVTASAVSSDWGKLMLLFQDVLLNADFPQAEIDKERAQMLEALKTSRDQPSNLMFEKLTQALYPRHPYGDVGSRLESALPQITREDLRQFYRRQMRPENLVISVVGNFDPDEMTAAMKQLVGNLESANTQSIKAMYPEVSPLKAPILVEAQKPEQAATWLAYGWLAPEISTSKDYVTLKTINTLLGSGLSSRLFVDLREKQGLAYHVSSLYPSTFMPSHFVMYIGTDPRNQDKVIAGFDAEIKKLQAETISVDELERVKSKLIGQFALQHETNAAQAFYLSLYETLGVGYRFDEQFPKLVAKVTAEDIQRVAKAIFNQPKVVTVVAPKIVRTGEAAAEAHP